MSARSLAAAVSSFIAVLSCAAGARAELSAESCSSAYARGQEERLAGRLFSARSAFKTCTDATCSAAVSADCRRWVTEVEADLPTVRLRVQDTHGAALEALSVSSDGVNIPQAELSQPVILEAGPHLLRFEAPGYQPLELEKALRPADRELAVNVVLHSLNEVVPAAPATPSAGASSAIPAWAIVFASAGVAALGTSVYFGLSARNQNEDLKASCAPVCTQSQADSVHSKALISDIALLTSAAAFGAAAWVYLSRGPSQPAVAALSFEPRRDAAAVHLHIAF